jgi:hypothetical protein
MPHEQGSTRYHVGPWLISSSSSSSSSTATHIMSGTLGGVALGTALLGPPGAVIGGIVGIVLSTGTELKIKREPPSLPVKGSPHG